ncbi:MAG: AhpC/TSA family protein [Actinomycetota bacterium]
MKVRDRWDRWRSIGATALFVVFDEPGLVRRTMLRELDDLPFPVLVDRDRERYVAWGLQRAPWWRIWLDPNVYRTYARLMRSGERLGAGGIDLLQLGGDFVIGPDQRIVYARPQHRDDRPPVGELLRAATEIARRDTPEDG